MIRRSTLVFLTCIAALGAPAMRTQSAASAVTAQASATQVLLLAQASGAQSSGESAPAGPLSIHAQGPAVKALQRRLKQSGYYSETIDGLYGLDTQRAVTAFQTDEGLTPTGSMDEETWLRLQALSSQGVSPVAQSSVRPADARATDVPIDVLTTDTTTPTAPTPSELPLSGEASTGVPIENQESGLKRMLGLSFGLVALLSIFGVGFYLTNRNKRTAADSLEGSGWGEIEDDIDLPPIHMGEDVHPTPTPFAGNTSSNGFAGGSGRPRENGGAGNVNSAITSTTDRQLQTGQIGGTAPLAKVDIIEGLIGDLRNPDPTRRRKAIWELGQRGNSLAMQPLVDSMVTADSKEKSLVLAALSEIGIRSLKPMSRALAIALQDDNPEVRKNAIRDLTRVYDLVVQISQMLGHATEDEDPEVRQTATWALDQLNRIRQSQDLDSTVRSFGGTSATPIDLLSSEASMHRTTQ